MSTSHAASRPRAIEPFWQRLPKISLYPLQGAALATLLVLAVARLVVYLPFGWLLNLFVSVALYKFAAEVLWRTANGRMTPPEGVVSDDGQGWLQVWVQVALWVFAFLSIFLLGPTLGIIAIIFIAFGAPGAMISAAIDQSFVRAINPLNWMRIMARIGWPYFVVALLCAVFLLSQFNAQALIVPALPGWLGIIVFYAIAHYVTIAAFHLMGYLVYQFHDALGYEIEGAPELPPLPGRTAPGTDADQSLLDEAEALVREDRAEEAEALLREQINARGATPAVHQRYRKLLALRGDRERSLQHARDYLSVLLAQDDERRAVDLVREAQELDPAFKPSSPDQVARVAARAAQMNHTQVALRLLSGFHKLYPKHRDIPKNYLLAAKLMAEKVNREEQARALLTQVRTQFPNDPLVPEIDKYLAFLDTLAATARPIPQKPKPPAA